MRKHHRPRRLEMLLAIQGKGMRTVEKVLETSIEKCALCGCQERNLRDLFGHKLCEQCYLGETENPEHAIY